MQLKPQKIETSQQRRAGLSGEAAATRYSEGLRAHLLRVYNYVGLGLGWSGIVAMLAMSAGLTQYFMLNPGAHIVFALVTLGVLWFASPISRGKSIASMQAYYWICTAMVGVLVGTTVDFYLASGTLMPIQVGQAFFMAAVMFLGLSVVGYTTKKDLSGWGAFLGMALLGLILTSFIGIFFSLGGLSILLSIGVIAVSLGIIAWNTQMIKQAYMEGVTHDYANHALAIGGALTLYIAFVNIFQSLLHLLAAFRE